MDEESVTQEILEGYVVDQPAFGSIRGRTYWLNAPNPEEAIRHWKRKGRSPADDLGGTEHLLR
jgi:hypothetical protein